MNPQDTQTSALDALKTGGSLLPEGTFSGASSSPIAQPQNQMPSNFNSLPPEGQQFLKALDYARQNPNSDFANAFATKIRNGEMAPYAKMAGIDLTPYVQKTQTPSPTTPSTPTNPIIKGLSAFGGAAKEVENDLTGNSGTLFDYINPLGYAAKGFNALVGGAKAGVNALANVTTVPLFSMIGTGLRHAIGDENVDEFLKNPTMQKVFKSVSDVANDPDVQAGLSAVNNIANLAATVALTKGGVESLNDLGSSIATKMGPKYVEGAASDWLKPSESPKGTYSTASDIVKNSAKNGNNIGETLVKDGVKLSDNIEGFGLNKIYSTAETADMIRNDAMKASNELLRPALEIADQNPNTPKISVNDIVAATKKEIDNSGATADAVKAQKELADKKGDALAEKYPEGMSLTNLHDERISYTQAGKYKPTGDLATTNDSAVNRAFGTALRTSLTDNAPKDIPVDEFQKELQKQFQAADYLESLNGKKVPVTAGERLRNYVGKIGGVGIVNKMIPGIGGILADIAGYHIGGMIESLLENMKSPVRESFLSNLQQTNPPAFDALTSYVKTGGKSLLGLPAPQEGEPNVTTPAITPVPPTTYERQAPVINYEER
ncbi:hypothetical protein M1506_00230 [Patescibacteria group bacterium]|nr:hypothetical protein [Patescibacteria group bacterium]